MTYSEEFIVYIAGEDITAIMGKTYPSDKRLFISKFINIGYTLFDKKSGRSLCHARTLKELDYEYKRVLDKYEHFIIGDYYQKMIKRFNELKDKKK